MKEVAASKGISMTKLHIKSEVAYNTIRRIFRDPYVEITTTTLGRLAEALEVPASELIEDVPESMDNSTRASDESPHQGYSL